MAARIADHVWSLDEVAGLLDYNRAWQTGGWVARYQLDFAVPERHDIAEPQDAPRNPTLQRLRAALSENPRWVSAMVAPFQRGPASEQHLIVCVDTEEATKSVVSDAVSEVVDTILPGVGLLYIFRARE